MLFRSKNYVSSIDLILNLLVPCIASVIVPCAIASRYIKPQPVEQLNAQDTRIGYEISKEHRGLSKLILVCGVAGLLLVPVFKATTGLPPYMGILISLGFLWLLTELIVVHYQLDGKMEGRISQSLRAIDMSTILFFLGILLAVGALQHAGILKTMSTWLR